MKNNTPKNKYNIFLLASLILVFVMNTNPYLMAQALEIDQNGNVGIGTNDSGGFKLKVNGSLSSTSGTFSGPLSSTSGTFSENISSTSGTFTGPVAINNNSVRNRDSYLNLSNRAYSTNNNATTPITRLRLNWYEGNQNLGGGEGVAIAFSSQLLKNGYALHEDARIATKKENYSDSDSKSALIFETANSLSEIPTEKLRIAADGNVGIGTDTPTQGKLVIDGSQNYSLGSKQSTVTSNYDIDDGLVEPEDAIPVYGSSVNFMSYINFFEYPYQVTWYPVQSEILQFGGSFSASIYASNDILATGFIAYSDARIKNIRGVSDSREDLNILKTIEITDYQMKDVIAKGNRAYKKVIAQQVKEVYPQAISLSMDVVPDIYQVSQLDNGWVALPTDLKTGDRVQLIFGSEKEIFKVLETSVNGFKVATDREGEVFVYGRQVNDFHSVDYEAISMLHVSATQELARKVEQLEKEKETTNGRLAKIEAALFE